MKLPRERTWQEKITLPLFVAAVFAAGGAWAQLAALSSKLDAIAKRGDDDHDRIIRLEVAAGIDRRQP